MPFETLLSLHIALCFHKLRLILWNSLMTEKIYGISHCSKISDDKRGPWVKFVWYSLNYVYRNTQIEARVNSVDSEMDPTTYITLCIFIWYKYLESFFILKCFERVGRVDKLFWTYQFSLITAHIPISNFLVFMLQPCVLLSTSL